MEKNVEYKSSLIDMFDKENAIELVKAIIKAKKNLRLYPGNNPIYIKTVDDIYSLLSSSLEHRESVIFKIKQYDIICDNEVVYHNKDKDENLAMFFFKDGVREINFLKGITRDEVNEFLRIISLDLEKETADDDIVTLIWEADFKFIKYVIDDAFLIEDETYEYIAVEKAKGVVDDYRQVMRAYEDALKSDDISVISIPSMTDDDIQNILKERKDDPRNKTGLFVHMLFEMLFLAKSKEEYEDITEIIKQALNYAIIDANIDVVNSTLSRIKSAFRISGYPGDVNHYLKRIEDHMNSADFIRLFGEVIDRGVKISSYSLSEFSSLLNIDSIPHFISLLGELKNISSRRIVINILSVVGKKNIPLIAISLNDKRWYVVRNIIYILRKMGKSESVEYLKNVASHTDKRVRKEAILGLGEMGSGDVLPILKECMSDEDQSVRITACRAISQISAPASKKLLCEYICTKTFRDRSFQEKKAVIGVLSRWKERDVIEFLTGIANKKTLFKRAKNKETRAAAAHCLDLIGAQDAGAPDRMKKSEGVLDGKHKSVALTSISHDEI